MGWKVKGIGDEIKEIWEDFYGNLWFLSELPDTDGIAYGYVRLYNMPEFVEWGYFKWDDINEAVGKDRVWRVSKENWDNINTYEPDLLIESS